LKRASLSHTPCGLSDARQRGLCPQCRMTLGDDQTVLALLSQLMVRTDPDQILDAALRCIARVGFSKTTFDDIAREAGCARATVYRIFPSKQQLVAALLNREGERLRTGVVDAALAEDDLAGAVTAFITT